jgi:hypothetical protein
MNGRAVVVLSKKRSTRPGRDGELSRLSAREVEHLAQRGLREVLACDQGVGKGADERYGSEIRDGVVARVFVQAQVESHVGEPAHEKGIAVGRRRRGALRPHERARAHAVLDDERLPELGAELVSEHPPDEVVAAAGRAGHDDAHRLRREHLRQGTGSRKQARRQPCCNKVLCGHAHR